MLSKITKYISEDIIKFRFNKFIYIFIFFFPALILLNSYYWMIIDYTKSYVDMIRWENQPVEIISVFVIIVSIIIGIKLILLMKRRNIESYKIIFISLMVSGLIFVGLEEVSWGQWLFNWKSPEYFKEANVQGETNIHNLIYIHMVFEYLRVFIGLGGMISIFLNNRKTFKYISSPFVLFLSFLIIIFFSVLNVYNFYPPNEPLPKEVAMRFHFNPGGFWFFLKFNMEIIELLIGLSAFIFLYSNYRRLKYSLN